MADNDDITPPFAAPAAPAAVSTATTGDNLPAETLAELQALPSVKRPSVIPRSSFMKKFTLLEDHDPRRLELVDDKNATHVCSFCNQCLQFNWRNSTKKGVVTTGFGSYDTTKAIKHLIDFCDGGGKDSDNS